MKTPAAVDTLTTRSGHWKLADLGAVGDSRAYSWKLDENADFIRIMVCRRAFTTEANDTSTLSLQDVPVVVVNRGTTYNWSLKVSQGSCRIMQNVEPVAPNAAWLREAVAALRIPSYKRERAFIGTLPALARDPARGAYDPSSLGPVPGSTATPTSADNFIGVTSAQGGEYTASRGFLHDVDAHVVDAALHNEDSLITAFMPEFSQYTFYSLAQPSAAVWSTVNNTTVDPQFPQAGDRPYEIARAASRTRTDVDSVIPADDWSRDESHLDDTGYVHWILTEDPVAGMLVQRQLAYHLANLYEQNRPNPQTAYGVNVIQERGLYNALSALWKSRDVSRRVTSTNGTVIWSTARAERMAAEGIASIDTQTHLFPSQDIARVTGAVTRPIDAVAWTLLSGGSIFYAGESNFQGFQYGKEPMWLWTRDGNAAVTAYLRAKARQAVVRVLYIGGTMGVDGAQDARGSNIPLGPAVSDGGGGFIPAPTPFANDLAWAAWLKVQPIGLGSDTTYDNAALHTTIQMKGMLLFAKNANLAVPELDAALARIDETRARTTTYFAANLQSFKHFGGPPD